MAKISDKNTRILILNKFNNKCAYCGVDLTIKNLTVDHIIPKRRGANRYELSQHGRGSDDIDNYNPCCYSCNSSKSTFSIEKWREEISKKHKRLLRDNSSYRLLNRFGLIKINTNVIFYFEIFNNKKSGKDNG